MSNSNNKNNGARRKELMPTTMAERKTGKFGFISIYISMSVMIAIFSLGGESIKEISLAYVGLAAFIGIFVFGILMTLVGDIGTEHGLPFPIYARAPFGPIGSFVPSMARSILGCIWFGIQSYYAALAVNFIVVELTGFDNMILWYVVLIVVQTVNVAMGFKAIENFANLAAPCIIIISVYLFYTISTTARANGIDLWNSIVGGGTPQFETFSSFLAVFLPISFYSISFWSTHSVDPQNLTRYIKTPMNERNWFKRNFNTMWGHMIALAIGSAFMIMLGASSFLVLGNWNPVEAIQTIAGGPLLVVLLILVIFAQWSTNISANLLPPAMTFLNIGKKYISYKTAVFLVGIIALFMQPWYIIGNFLSFLGVMSAVYGPIAGISVVDYYILRKRCLNVQDMYKDDAGQYNGYKGWNIAGMIGLAVGFVTANIWTDYGFAVGAILGALAYYVTGKYWWFKKHKQVEIENYNEKFLGMSVGHIWEIDEEQVSTEKSLQ